MELSAVTIAHFDESLDYDDVEYVGSPSSAPHMLALNCEPCQFTLILTEGEQMEQFLEVGLGIWVVVCDIATKYNPRVAHLAKHGRKARTRKKNKHRAYHIAEEAADQ